MTSSGLKGILNEGNTCYINSVLQCLSNTPAFRYVFIHNSDRLAIPIHPSSRTHGELVQSLTEFMKVMWSPFAQGTVMKTKPVRVALRGYTDKFEGSAQQDAQEFLLYLLAALHEETKIMSNRHSGTNVDRSTYFWEKFLSAEASPFSDIFVGQLRSTVRCPLCNHTSAVYEIFWELSLPVPSSEESLHNCLSRFFGVEKLKNYCQHCKRIIEMVKRYYIERLPLVLILSFKRFSSGVSQKISTGVEFPLNHLDVTNYMSLPGRERENGGSTYDLCAVSNHVGSSAQYGHYTAFCRKNGVGRLGRWYHYDDEKVSAIDASVLKSAEARNCAYILMYQRTEASDI